jgi:23S rRNA (guanosine2251-2'-O)-methyltransferase
MQRKVLNDELNRLTVDEFKQARKIPLILILDDVRSMHNIGSIFRSADAFLVEKIILCGISAVPPHKDIHKTALGATESVCWEYAESAIQTILKLKSNGYKVAGIEQTDNSVLLQNFMPQPDCKYAVIFGHEVRGVSQEVINQCDFTIEIPQFGTKHSLNVSVCAGILIWDVYRKLSLAQNPSSF